MGRITDSTNWAKGYIGTGNALTNVSGLASMYSYSGTNSSEARVRVTQGVTYIISIAVNQDNQGPKTESPFTLRLDLVSPPTNDNFADRIIIPSLPAAIRGTTLDATQESGEPPALYQYATVWYEWIAPASGIVRARLADCSSLMVGRVLSGNSLNTLQHVDGIAAEIYGESDINVQQGTAYQFEIWAQQSSPPPPSFDGPFTLRLDYNVPPANDHFTNRMRLTNRVEAVSYRAVGATLEPDETQIGSGRSVWYQWRAPESGTVAIWCDGTVGVYSGTEESRGALITNACYIVNFTAVAGQIYQITFDDCGLIDHQRPFNHSWTLSINAASRLNLNGKTNNTLNLNLYGDGSRSYALDSSTNLINWTPLQTNFDTVSGIKSFSENTASNLTPRFYRARPLE